MSYSSEVLADSPFIYLHLNETSGTVAADSSGNGHNGTYNGTVTLNQAGVVHDSGDAAVTLDGSTGYVSCPSTGVPTGNNPWTQEAWFKVIAHSSLGVIVGWGTNTTLEEPNFYIDSTGTLFMSTWNTDTSVQALTNGVWYHVVTTWDGTTHSCYVNGSLAKTSTPGTVATPTSPAFTIGRNPNPSEFFANITIQEVSAYATCLSAARVQAHYLAGLALLTQTRATFQTAASLQTKARSTFLVRTAVAIASRVIFPIQARLRTNGRGIFQVSTKLSGQSRATFKIAGNAVFPAGLVLSFASAVNRMQSSFSELTRIAGSWSNSNRLTSTFTRSAPVAQPNSTIDVTATVKLPDGTFPTISTIAVTVTFPDGTTGNYSLAGGQITSLGSGQYKLTYTTKSQGNHVELWTFTATDGSTAQYKNVTGCNY